MTIHGYMNLINNALSLVTQMTHENVAKSVFNGAFSLLIILMLFTHL